MVIVDGRVRKAELARILGLEELCVVLPEERLANLVMMEAHKEDHSNTPQDVMA